MSLFSFVVVPPAFYFLRKMIRRISTIAKRPVHRRHAHPRDHAGDGAGHPHRQGLHARRRDARAARRQRRRPRAANSNKWARVAHRASPLMEALGGFAIAFAHDLRRLPRDRNRRDAGPVLLLPRRLHAGLRAGEAAGAPQHRPQHRAGRRAHPVRDHRRAADRAASTTTSPPLKLANARVEFADVQFRLPAGRDRHPRPDASSPSPAR